MSINLDFYTPESIGTLLKPNIPAASAAGLAANLTAADADSKQVYLLVIDVQIDFIHPDGALPIAGAIDDTRRMVDWMYAHAPRISKMGLTLDTHLPIQIFHPAWWVDQNGQHPGGFTPITSADIERGVWRPLYDEAWSRQYVEILEETAKKQLMVWPYHVLLGTPGQALVPAVAEAVAYHTIARQAQPTYVVKGMIPQTENYSAIEPEVKIPEHPQGDVNRALLDEMAQYDKIYVAGQAKSHCLLETVGSMMRHYPPEQISKIRVLTDTMSSVGHPEIDFDAIADEAFSRWAMQGLTLMKTTDGMK